MKFKPFQTIFWYVKDVILNYQLVILLSIHDALFTDVDLWFDLKSYGINTALFLLIINNKYIWI